MKDRNKNRKGYKNTPVGWIPEDWELSPAGALLDIQLGKMLDKKARNGDNPQPYLANYNVRWGEFELSEVQNMSFYEKEMHKFQLQQGDLLVCEGGEVGRCAVWDDQIKPCYYQKALHRVRPSNGQVDVHFLMYYIQHAASSPMMVHFVGQSSISHFTRTQFLKFPIVLPPHPEQKKIVHILSCWDTAIRRCRSLQAAKRNLGRALMEQLLTGRKRLPGHTRPWKAYSLGELFQERNETNCGHLSLLAITGKQGVVSAAAIDRKDSSSADKRKYKRIVPGDIGYNTMRMWQGVSAVSPQEGIVSPAYTVCIPEKGVDAAFMAKLFKLPSTVYLFRRYSQGLVRDTLSLKFRHFAQIKIKVPGIREQRAIARALSVMDDEMQAQENRVAALERQKRGLMQKLLTGEVRINV